MEETFQQEKEESENKNQNEEQGGIRRRLRDRDLLRKRKAEAEEKETNQVESQRKRPRAESGTKRRGRPKKSELTSEIPVIQKEAAAGPQEDPAVVVVPEPAEDIPVQAQGSLLAVESQPSSALAPPAPLPVFGDIQNPVETLFIESQGRKAIGPVHVKDLDPDEDADISPSQDQTAEGDLIEPPSINVPEQNEMFSIPTWSSTPPPQKYFPGNAF
ncbi:hypothetical protein JOQ06_013071 [Pogonophryne albipinna]|uniref:Hemogen n=1 Tax=Pogonophryne albipinna TaxID=1090488 RepID=A0AAD6FRQ6_9TELE|nr:hypothetical protein JOQ06_013071 [Pogonophryne albipinna]